MSTINEKQKASCNQMTLGMGGLAFAIPMAIWASVFFLSGKSGHTAGASHHIAMLGVAFIWLIPACCAMLLLKGARNYWLYLGELKGQDLSKLSDLSNDGELQQRRSGDLTAPFRN